MNNSNKKIKVLFVCLGNICRSPMAESVFAQLVRNEGFAHYFDIQSAGTANYHVGETPDNRTIATLKGNGITEYSKAQQVNAKDLAYFDYILAMDKENMDNLLRLQNDTSKAKIKLFQSFNTNNLDLEIPDPYYGSMKDFSQVFDLIDAASKDFLAYLQRRYEWLV